MENKAKFQGYEIYVIFLVLIFISLNVNLIYAVELKLNETGSFLQQRDTKKWPDQLPQSRAAYGNRNIAAAWLANATDRYTHGILGDRLEAARLVVETRTGQRLNIDLPPRRVFEDLEPRLADVNKDSRDEIIVVESDISLGASLAVFGIVNDQLKRYAATSFLGRSNRWLNPLGVGDFNGDGKSDIALVATPHIGGKLRLYQFSNSSLSLFAEYLGVSTHRIGSTELGLGRVVPSKPRDRLLVPDQRHRVLMLLEWSPKGWRELTRAVLPGTLGSSLVSSGDKRWHFRLRDDRHFEIQLN